MADVSVMREFLARIGFDVDKAGFDRFTKSLATVTKRAAEVGIAIEAAAAAVVAGVVKITSQFDDLYWASQRLHDSAENIAAFTFGISEMGGTAAGARSSLEGLAGFMRNTPGWENLLHSLGVTTRDAKGAVLGTTDLMEQLAKSFKAMPYYRANVYAQMLGIDELSLQAMLRDTGEFNEKFKAFAKRLGLDMQQGAEASNKFMQQIRLLRAEFGLFLDKIALDLLQKYGPQFEAWMTRVADQLPQIISRIEDIGSQIITWALQLATWAERVWDFFDRLDKATGGWSTKLILLGAAIKLSGIGGLVTALLALGPEAWAVAAAIAALAGAFYYLKTDYDEWLKTGKSGLGIDWKAWSADVAHLKTDLSDLGGSFKTLGGDMGQLFSALGQLLQTVLPVLGPALDTLIKVQLFALHVALGAIIGDLKAINELLHGHPGAAIGDLTGRPGEPKAAGGRENWGTLLQGRLPNWATQGILDAPGAIGRWLKGSSGTATAANNLMHPAAYTTGGPIDWNDPENQPRTQVRVTRDLTDQMRQLQDVMGQAALNAQQTPSMGDLRSLLHDASLTFPSRSDVSSGATDAGAGPGAPPGVGGRGPAAPQIAAMADAIGKASGLSKAGSLAIAAITWYESAGYKALHSTNASNDVGLAQWHRGGALYKDFVNRMGFGPEDPRATLGVQMQVMLQQLKSKMPGVWQQLMKGGNLWDLMWAFGFNFEAGRSPGTANMIRKFDMPRSWRAMGDLPNTYLGGQPSETAQGGEVHHHLHGAPTTVHIDGSHDPHATAREVEVALNRVNGDLVRNFKTAIV